PPPQPPRPTGAAARPGEKAPKAGTLEEAIDLALELAVNRQLEEMLERFMTPDDKKERLNETTIQAVAKDAGEDDVIELIDCLKKLKGMTPEMSEDGSKARFGLNDPKGPEDITFVKIMDVWYIED
ncbi:MAG: hypothetical protein ACYS9X_28130, partial [Planctomycetota bacterium]